MFIPPASIVWFSRLAGDLAIRHVHYKRRYGSEWIGEPTHSLGRETTIYSAEAFRSPKCSRISLINSWVDLVFL